MTGGTPPAQSTNVSSNLGEWIRRCAWVAKGYAPRMPSSAVRAAENGMPSSASSLRQWTSGRFSSGNGQIAAHSGPTR